MHNHFIVNLFDWQVRPLSKKARFVNGLLKRLGYRVQLSAPPISGSMTNVEKRMNMYHLASQVLVYGIPGHFVELGCHAGQSAVLLQKIIIHFDLKRKLHVYDSFAGLPEVREEDEGASYQAGQMAVGQEVLTANFRNAGVPLPEIHLGWFRETLPDHLPDVIAFAHLDGDLYDSIKVSLEHVYPRLSSGAVCLIDDYSDPLVSEGWNKLPGVKRACDDYLADKPESVSVLYAGDMAQGFFRKLPLPVVNEAVIR